MSSPVGPREGRGRCGMVRISSFSVEAGAVMGTLNFKRELSMRRVKVGL